MAPIPWNPPHPPSPLSWEVLDSGTPFQYEGKLYEVDSSDHSAPTPLLPIGVKSVSWSVSNDARPSVLMVAVVLKPDLRGVKIPQIGARWAPAATPGHARVIITGIDIAESYDGVPTIDIHACSEDAACLQEWIDEAIEHSYLPVGSVADRRALDVVDGIIGEPDEIGDNASRPSGNLYLAFFGVWFVCLAVAWAAWKLIWNAI